MVDLWLLDQKLARIKKMMKLKVEVCCKLALLTFTFTPQITCVYLWGLTNASSVFQCFKHNCVTSALIFAVVFFSVFTGTLKHTVVRHCLLLISRIMWHLCMHVCVHAKTTIYLLGSRDIRSNWHVHQLRIPLCTPRDDSLKVETPAELLLNSTVSCTVSRAN